MVSPSNLFNSAFMSLICVSLFSCGTSVTQNDNLNLAIEFLGVEDLSYFYIEENGNHVIFTEKISGERFICIVSDNNYVKTYKYFNSAEDSYTMSFYNDSTLANDYNIQLLNTAPPISSWPTNEPIEFTFPKIPFGWQTLLLNSKNAKGKSTTIDSVKIVDGKCTIKIPFSSLEKNGFGLSFRFKSKYSKYSVMQEWVFGNVLLK